MKKPSINCVFPGNHLKILNENNSCRFVKPVCRHRQVSGNNYTVSINVFSTLLKISKPTNKMNRIIPLLYNSPTISKLPFPNKAYFQLSTIGVSGFHCIHLPYHLFFMNDKGYTMGVTYMSSCTPKPINTVRSRYLVVSDEMIIPRPSPRPAIIINNTGIQSHAMPK